MQEKIENIMKKIRSLNKNQKIVLIAILLIAILLSGLAINILTKDNIKNGIWVKGDSMESVNLDTLSENGIENIFLHSSAVNIFGEKKVSEWIKKANDKDITVHIWVQCFYNGTWVNPIDTKKQEFNYPYFNKKVDEIEKLAAIPGVGGIQLDYIRYPGNAHEYSYSNGIAPSDAITKFVSMVSDRLNNDLALSVTVMPEKEGIKYYGQDVYALSWHVDVIVPMAYEGNYNQDDEWIKDISYYFKSNSIWSNVCIGIQNYVSDNNESSKSADEIKENCQAALDGGADGVGIFTWELMKNWFDLKNLNYSLL